jgi:predicted NBD/HSP70 family sugar kinase
VRIGVDLGGTKIEIITLDDNGATVLRRRVQTPVGDYAGTVRTIAELVSSAQSQIGASATVRNSHSWLPITAKRFAPQLK